MAKPFGKLPADFLRLKQTKSFMEELFEQLSQQIHPIKGTVLVWNESFEKTQDKLMAEPLPLYAQFLYSVNEMVYDMMKIFSQGLYLHLKFKAVLYQNSSAYIVSCDI